MGFEGEEKRLFFGLEVAAPWPDRYPRGRLIPVECRHATLVFLGNIPWEPLQALRSEIPPPPFILGPMGVADSCLLLPPRHSKVVAWHVTFAGDNRLEKYQQTLSEFLRGHDYVVEDRPFLPHVTVARAPFDAGEWRECFHPLPMIVKGVNLYETVGSLQYERVWQWPLKPAIEALEHTADVAYKVRGETIQDLQNHAFLALAWEWPLVLQQTPILRNSLEDVISDLNRIVTLVDTSQGCPFKAVSYHGDILHGEDGLLEWEMIVDV